MEQVLQQALDAETKSEAFHLMLSLVYPLELMADAERAAEILQNSHLMTDKFHFMTEPTRSAARQRAAYTRRLLNERSFSIISRG